MRILTMIAALIAVAAPANAEPAVVGDWTITVRTDPMTDNLDCSANYLDNPYIVLTPRTLSFHYTGRGGLSIYKYRFGDDRAEGPHRARLNSITFGSSGLFKLRDAIKKGRVRVQAVTLIAGMIEEDVDLSGAPAALAEMKAMGCAD